MELARETDLEILRSKAVLLNVENQLLHRRLARLAAELDRLRGTDDDSLQTELDLLRKQINSERGARFAPSSERRGKPAEPDGGAADDGGTAAGGASEASTPTPGSTGRKRGHGPTAQPSLPVIDEVHELAPDDRACASCGGELRAWSGQFEDSEQVDVVERSFRIVRHRRQKYRCSCGGCIRSAPAPFKLTPQGRYSLAFVICVAVAKYLDHAPLARQTRQMARQGLVVTTQTLCDQLEQLAGALRPSWKALRGEILVSPVIGVDETTWPLLDQANRCWWAWSIAGPAGVYYRIAKTRSHADAERVLDGFEGTAVCDAFSAYPALRNKWRQQGKTLELATCWAHARRGFVKAEAHHPEAAEVLEIIGRLYAVEAKARELAQPGSDAWRARLAELRRTESAALLEELDRWRRSASFMPRSQLGKAVGYLDNQRLGLRAFLRDPLIPLDNNDTERAVRGLALGRKNHYGSKSEAGTEVAAILYSLLESAKRLGVEPERYLQAAVMAGQESPSRVLTPAAFAAQRAGRGAVGPPG